MYYAREFLHFIDFKKAAHLTVYILAIYLFVITCALHNVRTFIKIGEYLTALFIIIAKVGSLIIQPLQFNATAILYKLAICKGKIYGIVLYEIAILLTHFMKEYFNAFDDIQFFHTFSSISRDM